MGKNTTTDAAPAGSASALQFHTATEEEIFSALGTTARGLSLHRPSNIVTGTAPMIFPRSRSAR